MLLSRPLPLPQLMQSFAPALVIKESRCKGCSKLLFKLHEEDAVYETKCNRCGLTNSFRSVVIEDVVITDATGRINYVNGWASRIADCSIGNYIGQVLMLPNWAALTASQPDFLSALKTATLESGGQWCVIESADKYKISFNCGAYLLITTIYSAEKVLQFVVFNFHRFPEF